MYLFKNTSLKLFLEFINIEYMSSTVIRALMNLTQHNGFIYNVSYRIPVPGKPTEHLSSILKINFKH